MGNLEFLLKSTTINFTKVYFTFIVRIMFQPKKTSKEAYKY